MNPVSEAVRNFYRKWFEWPEHSKIQNADILIIQYSFQTEKRKIRLYNACQKPLRPTHKWQLFGHIVSEMFPVLVWVSKSLPVILPAVVLCSNLHTRVSIPDSDATWHFMFLIKKQIQHGTATDTHECGLFSHSPSPHICGILMLLMLLL